MRTKIFKTAALALACLAGILAAPAAHAEETAQVTLIERQILVNNGLSEPPSDVFIYQLTAETPNAPMPENARLFDYLFTVTGNGQVHIGPIVFHEAGVYTYTLSCVTDEMPGYTIDRQSYTIEMYVADDLTVSAVYSNDNAKVEELVFTHSYTSPNEAALPSETPPPPVAAPPPETTLSPPPGAGFSGDGPKTGDPGNPVLWTTLIVGSSVLLLMTCWFSWNRRRES